MPTIISHAVIGMTGTNLMQGENSGRLKLVLLSILCAIAPDADVITFKLGIAYGDFFGHRGFFHSIFFAAVLDFSVRALFYRSDKLFSGTGFFLSAYFSIIAISHGVLDAFTNGGLGIALLSPFDNTRYFFWKTPIQVAAIKPAKFFSAHGIRVMSNEMLWVWLPCLLILAFSFLYRKYRQT